MTHHPRQASMISSSMVGLVFLAIVPNLQAQNRFAAGPGTPPFSASALLSGLSNYRVVRWASAGSVIHCGPAPLTERPGVHAEFLRPHVVPLEEAFADAESVKRALEYRARAVAMENH